jgi:small neutral amino acid transporter SnatA (MarC family)
MNMTFQHQFYLPFLYIREDFQFQSCWIIFFRQIRTSFLSFSVSKIDFTGGSLLLTVANTTILPPSQKNESSTECDIF